jgi:hypothetical protein
LTIAKRLKTRLSEKQNPIKTGGGFADNCTAVAFVSSLLRGLLKNAVTKEVNAFRL